MTKVAEIVRDALMVLRVIDKTESPDADDAKDSVRALNLMMRAWETDGLPLGWSDVVDVTDDLPLPPEAEEAVTYNLAKRLQGKFGASMSPDDLRMAESGEAMLRSQAALNDYARVSYDDLPVGTGQRSGSWQDGFFR